ncbi:hypothetical protein CYY_003588 [Polysphondylium violaceum]|uniref:SWIM-type domain-containing protein n=1 Tax=Polysphondylium violaceum TaxID=133409 RepID=A0A8J4PWS6_9MYCE|nr:hypothetical protein CYY_003588 [Polysphondylium violaceum]
MTRIYNTLKDLTLRECETISDSRHDTYGEPRFIKLGFTYVEAKMRGTLGTYKIQIYLQNGRLHTSCTCPVGGSCKHIREVAIAMHERLKDIKISRYTQERAYKESLQKLSRDQLIKLMVEEFREDNVDEDEDEDDDDDELVDDEESEHSADSDENYHDPDEETDSSDEDPCSLEESEEESVTKKRKRSY